tara:strand:+ start:7352 stop:7531 length:180 start_codon:yes stop_codon:yes gene_type:complete
MRKASGTHRSMGKKGGVTPGLESGVAETMKVGNTNPDEVSGSQRPKPQKHGSIAAGKSK